MHFSHLEILAPLLLSVAAICQYVAWRLKLPAILFLLLVGVIAGPVLHLISPDETFGELLMPAVSLSVAIILFEGSLSLHFSEIREVRQVVRNLVSTGMLINWFIIAIATHYIMDLSWGISWLFGALVVVTGPTVIVPMLRSVRPNSQVSSVLKWEGILIDPIGALLAVLVFTWLAADTGAFTQTIMTFFEILCVGIVVGLLAGQILGWLIRHYIIPDFLQTLTALAFVLSAFVLSNELATEAGLLAVTVMGIRMANMKDVHVEDILHFKEHLSLLLISALFILLSARINLASLTSIALPALMIFAVMQFIARPLAVFGSSLKSRLSWQEKIIIAWIGPRGIVAAAVSALFAFRLSQTSMEGANLLVPLTFFMIVATVVFQSATAAPLARFLKVAEPENKGFLIIGANTVSTAIAKALMELGCRVTIASSSWVNVQKAKLDGVKVYYGNPASELADMHLDLIGLGHLLSLSSDPNFNTVAAMKYRSEFGRENIFHIDAHRESESMNKRIAQKHKGHKLNKDISFSKLSSLLSKGAKIRTTLLTDEFTFTHLTEGKKVIPLLSLSPNGKVRSFDEHFSSNLPVAGYRVISVDYTQVKDITDD